MNVHYAKFQKSLIVEQFQGNYLKERFDIKTNFLTFYGVISSMMQPPSKGNCERFIDVF